MLVAPPVVNDDTPLGTDKETFPTYFPVAGARRLWAPSRGSSFATHGIFELPPLEGSCTEAIGDEATIESISVCVVCVCVCVVVVVVVD